MCFATGKRKADYVGKTQKNLVQRLKELRKIHHVTQEEFSERTGISYKYYQAIETGVKKELRISTLERLAEHGGIWQSFERARRGQRHHPRSPRPNALHSGPGGLRHLAKPQERRLQTDYPEQQPVEAPLGEPTHQQLAKREPRGSKAANGHGQERIRRLSIAARPPRRRQSNNPRLQPRLLRR